MTTHMMNICGKFHWNISTKYKDTVSHEKGVIGQRMDGRLDNWKTQYLYRLLLTVEAQKMTKTVSFIRNL